MQAFRGLHRPEATAAVFIHAPAAHVIAFSFAAFLVIGSASIAASWLVAVWGSRYVDFVTGETWPFLDDRHYIVRNFLGSALGNATRAALGVLLIAWLAGYRTVRLPGRWAAWRVATSTLLPVLLVVTAGSLAFSVVTWWAGDVAHYRSDREELEMAWNIWLARCLLSSAFWWTLFCYVRDLLARPALGLLADSPARAPVCWRCGYDLTGLPADNRCPECGEAAPQRAGSGPAAVVRRWELAPRVHRFLRVFRAAVWSSAAFQRGLVGPANLRASNLFVFANGVLMLLLMALLAWIRPAALLLDWLDDLGVLLWTAGSWTGAHRSVAALALTRTELWTALLFLVACRAAAWGWRRGGLSNGRLNARVLDYEFAWCWWLLLVVILVTQAVVVVESLLWVPLTTEEWVPFSLGVLDGYAPWAIAASLVGVVIWLLRARRIGQTLGGAVERSGPGRA